MSDESGSRPTPQRIYELVRDADEELARPARALAFSGLFAGFTIGATPLAVAAALFLLDAPGSEAFLGNVVGGVASSRCSTTGRCTRRGRPDWGTRVFPEGGTGSAPGKALYGDRRRTAMSERSGSGPPGEEEPRWGGAEGTPEAGEPAAGGKPDDETESGGHQGQERPGAEKEEATPPIGEEGEPGRTSAPGDPGEEA